MTPIGVRTQQLLRLPTADHHVMRCANRCEDGAALIDLGCGARSALRRLAPRMHLLGVDSEPAVLDDARARCTHDDYVMADVAEGAEGIRRAAGERPIQLVCLVHVIEHLAKPDGFALLDIAENLTARFVVVDTPNRFLPQGPEWGSRAQRHLSGWFWQDFVGRGYDVHGTSGTRWLRGYAGAPKVSFRGVYTMDAILSRVLMVGRNPGLAYNLTAIKDVRGVPARLGPRPDPVQAGPHAEA